MTQEQFDQLVQSIVTGPNPQTMSMLLLARMLFEINETLKERKDDKQK